MLRASAGAMALLAALAAAAAEPPPPWRIAVTGGDPFAPDVAVYFDAARLAADDGALSVHALWRYREPQPPTGHRAMLAEVRIRCSGEAATVRASLFADASAAGAPLARFAPDALEWTAVVPKTLGDGLRSAACAEGVRRGLVPPGKV
jgi:hypothetical protein